MGPAEADAHILAAFDLWKKRNRSLWTFDLAMLKQAGIGIQYPIGARDRPADANAGLTQVRRRTT